MKNQKGDCALCGLPFDYNAPVWLATHGWCHSFCQAQRLRMLHYHNMAEPTRNNVQQPVCAHCGCVLHTNPRWEYWVGPQCEDCRALRAGSLAAALRVMLTSETVNAYALTIMLRWSDEIETRVKLLRQQHEAQIKFRLKPTVAVRPAAPHRDSDSQGTQPDDEV